MLDRAHGKEGAPGVFLYSHWSGSELPYIAAYALNTPAARGRSTDLPYLTRIMADALSMHSGGPGNEVGMGISLGICDNEHPILVFDVTTQSVWESREDEALRMPPGWPDTVMAPSSAQTFETFIVSKREALEG